MESFVKTASDGRLPDEEFFCAPKRGADTSPGDAGEPVFSVAGVSGEGFDDISFEAYPGRILSVSGFRDSGVLELADALMNHCDRTGAHTADGILETPRRQSSRTFQKTFAGTFKSLFGNAGVKYESVPRETRMLCIAAGQSFGMQSAFSDAGRQKAVLKRLLDAKTGTLLICKPLQGADIGARLEIRNLILQLAQKGCAVVLFGTEPYELLALADSFIILRNGKIAARAAGSEMSWEIMLRLSGEPDSVPAPPSAGMPR
jgi:ribose transport system ATP-binding protein